MKAYVAYVLPPSECVLNGMGIEMLTVGLCEEDSLTRLRVLWDKEMSGQEDFFDKDSVWQKMMHNFVHKIDSGNDYEIHIAIREYPMVISNGGNFKISA